MNQSDGMDSKIGKNLERMPLDNWRELRRIIDEEKNPSSPDDREIILEIKAMYEILKERAPKSVQNGMYMEISETKAEISKTVFTDTNATIGILAACVGQKDDARSLYELIKKNVPRGDTGLFRLAIGEFGSQRPEFTEDNALVGILAFMAGCENDAGDIYRLIRANATVGSDGLYTAGCFQSTVPSESATATVGILAHALRDSSESMRIYERMKYATSDGITDMTLGVLAAAVGDRTMAEIVRSDVKQEIASRMQTDFTAFDNLKNADSVRKHALLGVLEAGIAGFLRF